MVPFHFYNFLSLIYLKRRITFLFFHEIVKIDSIKNFDIIDQSGEDKVSKLLESDRFLK